MLENFRVNRRNFLLSLMAFSGSVAASQLPIKRAIAQTRLVGAGASFPAPLYQRWFSDYNQQTGIEVAYQSVGSGSGVKQFMAGTVDFGASDVAMKDDEIREVSRGVVLLPMTAGSIVVAYNQPGVTLQLTRQQLVDIFLGNITNWSQIGGPNQSISVVYRSDGSGTTGVFTKHLSAINSTWRNGPGEGKSIQWPVGTGAKGNEGVTAQVKSRQGTIGYVEYSYAALNNLSTAKLQNKAGSFVEANLDSASASLAQVQLPANLRAFISDPTGAGSYPIVTYTWILAYKNYGDSAKAQALKAVLKWCLVNGEASSRQLGYIPLPANVKSRVSQAIDTIS